MKMITKQFLSNLDNISVRQTSALSRHYGWKRGSRAIGVLMIFPCNFSNNMFMHTQCDQRSNSIWGSCHFVAIPYEQKLANKDEEENKDGNDVIDRISYMKSWPFSRNDLLKLQQRNHFFALTFVVFFGTNVDTEDIGISFNGSALWANLSSLIQRRLLIVRGV